MSIARADGSELTLAGPDLADPPSFPEGPPLVWMQDGAPGFLRPVRDEADVNAGDLIVGEAGGTLTVTVQSGAVLEVLAGADGDAVDAGETVRFWASASGVDPGQRLRFRWHFDDGTEATGQNVKHRFRAAGRYRVYVTVSADGRAGGTSPVIPVKVGDPDAVEQEQEQAPAAAPGGGTGAATGGGGAAGGAGAAGSPAPAGAPATTRRVPARPVRRRERPRPAPAAAPGVERVRGVLIDADAVPAATPSPAPAARAAARDGTGARDGAGGGLPGEAWGGLLVAGLLGSGFLLDRVPGRWRPAT